MSNIASLLNKVADLSPFSSLPLRWKIENGMLSLWVTLTHEGLQVLNFSPDSIPEFGVEVGSFSKAIISDDAILEDDGSLCFEVQLPAETQDEFRCSRGTQIKIWAKILIAGGSEWRGFSFAMRGQEAA